MTLAHIFLKPVYLLASVSVIIENIFLLQLNSPSVLLRHSLFINKAVVLLPEMLICTGALLELIIDTPVLLGESLKIFVELSHFLCFQLGNMRLLFYLLSEVVNLIS